jgi:Ca-activated chloride channel family protein
MVSIRALLSVLALVAMAALPARAAGEGEAKPGKVMIVLDGSGSMWGQIDGTPKISIARDAIRELMAGWDPNLELGLSTYGYRRNGDCADIETLISVGQADPQAVVAAVEAIKPKGKTPLTEAVKQAAETLRYTEDAATVILISDGLETCDADPCAVATTLSEAGVAFRTHVIGFDLKKTEQEALRCLAENTGGVFIAAGDAASLQKALGEVVEATVTEVKVKAEPPAPQPAAVPGIRFKALYAEGGPQIKSGLSWEVYEAQADIEGKRKRVTYSYDTEPVFELAPGAYLLSVKVGAASGSVEFEAGPESAQEVTVVLDAGLAAVSAKRTAASEPITGNLSWEVYLTETDIDGKRQRVTYSYDNQPLFTLSAGRYLLSVGHGASGGQAEFEVKAGKRAEVEIVLNSGIAAMSAVLTEGMEPIGGGLHWEIWETETDIEGKRKRVTYS